MPTGLATGRSILMAVCSVSVGARLAVAAPCAYASDIERAGRMLRAGLYVNAVGILETVIAKLPTCDPEAYRLLATAELNQQAPDRALNAALRGVKAFPHSTPLQVYYASLVENTLPREQRSAALERALAVAADSGPLLKALGLAELQLNRESEQAGKHLQQALALLPEDVEVRCYRAQWLLVAHREAEALILLNAAYALTKPVSPDRVSVLRLRAAAYDSLNGDAGASAAYVEAAAIERQLASHPIQARWEYAQSLLAHDADAEARPVLDELIAADPRFGPAYFARAKLADRAGQLAAAMQDALVALELAPGIAEQKPLHAFLSRLCHRMNDEAAAREHEQWIAAH